jgi:acetyl-CoA carboxylase carboxyltransferase component
MHDVVRRVVDDGEFLEVHELWAENVICGLARLAGIPSAWSATSRARSPVFSTSTPR